LALLAVGQFGTAADLPLLEKAFDDSLVFHETRYTSKDEKGKPVVSQVGDAAIAAALHLSGQHPADFDFPILKENGDRGPDVMAKYHLLGFFDDDSRQATHKKAKEWLAKQPKTGQPDREHAPQKPGPR